MKSLFMLLLLLTSALSLCAQQTWTKEVQAEYEKSALVNVCVDMSRTQYMDMDSAAFVEYYAEKIGKSPKYIDAYLKRFRKSIFDNLKKRINHFVWKGPQFGEYKSVFEIVVRIDNITEKAGLSGYVFLRKIEDREVVKVRRISLEDGKWNSQENLLYEQVEPLAKIVAAVAKPIPRYVCYCE